MLRPVLPATLNRGLSTADSSFFLASCGNAPSKGCARTTKALPTPLPKDPPFLLYWSETSWKLADTSCGKVFLGLASFFGSGAAFGAGGCPGGLVAGGSGTVLGAGAAFRSAGAGLAGATGFCVEVAGTCSACAFLNRD